MNRENSGTAEAAVAPSCQVPPALAGRLAGLPRYKGRPVPSITAWPGETVPAFRPGQGWMWDCECKPGRGTPRLGEICPARQRRLMAGRRCQLCSRPVTGEPFWIIGAEDSEWLKDPPFHAACGRYALAVCPGLQLPLRDTSVPLRMIRCDAYDLAFTTEYGRGYLTAGQAANASDMENLVKWAWARPVRQKSVYTLAEWSHSASPGSRTMRPVGRPFSTYSPVRRHA